MSKYNRSGKVRAKRRWFQNVGDPNRFKGAANPNDTGLSTTGNRGKGSICSKSRSRTASSREGSK